jgi:hypothetical protein
VAHGGCAADRTSSSRHGQSADSRTSKSSNKISAPYFTVSLASLQDYNEARRDGHERALDQGALDSAQPIGATEITFDIGDKAIECLGRPSAAVELAAAHVCRCCTCSRQQLALLYGPAARCKRKVMILRAAKSMAQAIQEMHCCLPS